MLENTRTVQTECSSQRKIVNTISISASGICMGAASKALDETDHNALPTVMQALDITNFLGRFAVWILIAVCLSVYSSSAKRAALHVFLFFAGMVSSYYLYSAFIAGFFPLHYALIWCGFTVISPLLACICWYARGSGWAAILISAGILGVLLAQAVFLFQGIRIAHIPEVLVWLAALWVLRRERREFAIMVGISVPVAIVCQLLLPYWG